MAITYQNQKSDYLPVGRRRISAWVKRTILSEGFGVGDIAYVFCSPEYHIAINREYLGHDYHTDVITFDYSDLAGKRRVSGDILIDPRQVFEQAARWNSTEDDEMLRVMIHGVLHLCGYGDKTPAEEKTMRAREDHYLADYHSTK